MTRATSKFVGLTVAFLICVLAGAGWLTDARERNGQNNGYNKNNLTVDCSKDGDRHTHDVRDRIHRHQFSSRLYWYWNQGYIFNGPPWLRDTTFIYEGTPYFFDNGIYFTRIGNVFAATTPPFTGYNSAGADNTACSELTDRQATDTITIDVPAGERARAGKTRQAR